jgi:hypothetical protein
MAKSFAATLVALQAPFRRRLRTGRTFAHLKKGAPLALSVLLLVGAAAIVYARSDWPTVGRTLGNLSWLSIGAGWSLMLAGALLASLRLKLIAGDLGYRLSFRDAIAALSLGQLAGVLFFQIAGQLMARGLLLSRRRIPVSGTIMVTGYERLAALAVSFALAMAGATYLFGAVSINRAEGGILIIKIVLGLAAVAAGGAVFVWGGLVARSLPPLTARGILKLGRSIALSVAIQLATMSAYVLLLRAMAPNIPVASLAAASALVMFAASLPISFAGWGMRELSAILALGTLGVGADVSFAVAALIGLTSLSVVGLMAAATIHHARLPAAGQSRGEPAQIDFAAMLDYALPIFVATAVFFQVFVPVDKGAINVNLADPAAILGGCLFVLHHLKKGWPRWRLPYFELYVVLASVLMVTAFLHGLERFGWTNWAFTNRLLGWFVLLAYGATGALIVSRANGQALDLLLKAFVVAAASVVAFETALLVLYAAGVESVKPLVQMPFVGFSVNKNAYAFQMLLAVCVILAARWKKPVLILALVLIGIWFSGSRASFLGLAIVMGAAAYMRCLSPRSTFLAFGLAGWILLAIAAIPQILVYLGSGHEFSFHVTTLIVDPAPSDHQRWHSLVGGWAMFLSHPLFGAGLGAYMDEQMRAGTPLVIHSTPLWLLAEMGAIGFMIMAAPIVRIFWRETRKRNNADSAGLVLILIITAFGVVANLHDVMYQRAFWLLLGAALACVGSRATGSVQDADSAPALFPRADPDIRR